MTHKHNHLAAAFAFERFGAANVPCPACGSALGLFDKNEPATDAFCSSDTCKVEVQVKLNRSSVWTTHPQDRKKFEQKKRNIGARNIYFAVGTEKELLVHLLSTRKKKVRRADRTRKNGRRQERIQITFKK